MLELMRVLSRTFWNCKCPRCCVYMLCLTIDAEQPCSLSAVFCRTSATYENILKVNVVGPYLVTRTFVPLLLKRNTRTVVQISSGLGSLTRSRLGITDPKKNPVGNKWIAYNASKAALNMRKCDAWRHAVTAAEGLDCCMPAQSLLCCLCEQHAVLVAGA